MIYKELCGLKLSALGMGCMRLPVVEGQADLVDEAAAAELIALAMEHGVNYYDTAWGYHGGQSEPVMGRLLSAYPRERFYLASKFPGYALDNIKQKEEIFNRQLERCQVDHFDFYLFHTVTERNIDAYLDPQYGLMSYLLEQKAQGHIRHLGFSCHGELPVLKRFLETCGEHLEFCQLQMNYIDWTLQHGREKAELVRSFGIPMWVMEPVRGGKLAALSPKHEQILKSLRPEESIPAWAFRFIQSLPGVGVTLSGMSTPEQVRDNLKTFDEAKPLTDREMEALLNIAAEIIKTRFLPCTACRYCVDQCPQGLDIPALLSLYNDYALSSEPIPASELSGLPAEKRPAACVACHSCETVCPQQIRIAEAMTRMAR